MSNKISRQTANRDSLKIIRWTELFGRATELFSRKPPLFRENNSVETWLFWENIARWVKKESSAPNGDSLKVMREKDEKGWALETRSLSNLSCASPRKKQFYRIIRWITELFGLLPNYSVPYRIIRSTELFSPPTWKLGGETTQGNSQVEYLRFS